MQRSIDRNERRFKAVDQPNCSLISFIRSTLRWYRYCEWSEPCVRVWRSDTWLTSQ